MPQVWHCNATEGTLYLALQGIVECASFEVDTEVYYASDPLPYECGGEMPESMARAGETTRAAIAPLVHWFRRFP